MSKSLVDEYIGNMRELLRQNPAMFGMMVERQVQVRLLPKLRGPRNSLEPDLWALTVFCLDGSEAEVPQLDDSTFERAQEAAEAGSALSSENDAAFPKAAKAVVQTLGTLREAGVYPPPKI